MVDDSFGCPRSWSRCSPGGTSHRCWTRASPNQARTTPYSSWNFPCAPHATVKVAI